MSINEVVGSVARLWRFPVKSMGGEQLQEVEATKEGILGDRAYALIDNETGKVVSAKSARLFPGLVEFSAKFIEEPHRDRSMPEVEITLPDGTSVRSDSGDVDGVLSAHFKRDIRLERVAPDDFTIDQYHPDVEGTNPGGKRNTVAATPLGSALFAAIGEESPLPVGSFLDAFPMSVLTTSSLARMNKLEPQIQFDERRFRMNVIIETERPGFIENGWQGYDLTLGDKARLTVTWPAPRCVMTTLAQGDLPRDTDVLRALVRHNKQQVGDLGQYPCLGVYASVAVSASLRIGDPVALV